MIEVTINYFAVLVATVISMVLGGFWYSPVLFGNQWLKLSGMTQKQIEAKKKSCSATKSHGFMVLGTLLMMYVFAHFVAYMQATTYFAGMQTGFWIWLGFVVPLLSGTVIWEGKSVQLYAINVAYYLVLLLVTGGLLAVW